MSFSFASALHTVFGKRLPAPQLTLVEAFKAQFPQSQHLSMLTWRPEQFPVITYLSTIGITATHVPSETHYRVGYDEDTKTVRDEVAVGVFEFTYESVAFRLFKAQWQGEYNEYYFDHLVFAGADDSVGKRLTQAVYGFANDVNEEIWVFEDAHWEKSKELYKAVQHANWDEVVLEDEFKEGLRRDTQTFFASKDTYDALGVTWKRGILLLGPPGNGKTESIKALLKETKGVSPLYVKSFTTCRGPESGIRDIFQHARSHAPCILILEDLDSMLVPESRSFFLNELDGLAKNEGILTIATTNHPERIDDAIINRPSRFDVKYNFALPDGAMRRAFAIKWLAKVNAVAVHTGLAFDRPEESADAVAAKTDGWSYAFLKELFVSFLLRLAHDSSLRQRGVKTSDAPVEALLMEQVDKLAHQIIKTETAGTVKEGGSEE